MAKSKNGERYAIGIAVGIPNGHGGEQSYQVYNDAAINKFTLDITLNALPRGTATITGPANGTFPVSGGYGYLGIGGVPGAVDTQIPIYITEMNSRQIVSGNMIVSDISFVIGTPEMHAIMPATAVTGTSRDAISELLSMCLIGAKNMINKYSDADIMVWRLVEGTLEDHLKDIVNHSTIPGDIMYWTYDDLYKVLEVGSFNSSYESTVKYGMISSTNALQPTSAACYSPKGVNAVIWPYSTYYPSDVSGNYRDKRKPNVIMDSTGPDGDKSTGRYDDLSWYNLIKENGGEMTFMDGVGAYGALKVVKPYPMNTHKMYSVAPLIRDFMMASYTRTIQVNIYNHPGPVVGSCVYFCATPTDSKMGNVIPDPRFTARYIVVHKRIVKDATTSTGLLGTTKHTENSDLITELTLMAKNDYLGAKSPEYEAVVQLFSDINQNMNTSTEKK